MRGKTISIYLPDANPKSIKICDINNSIVKGISVPRIKLESVSNREELNNPGLYFLFGEQDELGRYKTYIGEAEILLDRIKQHNKGKEFWDTVLCFVSEKKNINKAHIKYLENYSCLEAKKINKCILENSVTPTQSSLTEQDRDFMLSFFEDIKLITSTLGYNLFEDNKQHDNSEIDNKIYCKGKEAKAEALLNEDGTVTVLKGSVCNGNETESSSPSLISLRFILKESKILKEENNILIFTEDKTFDSLSKASNVVLARSSNGWIEWKDKNGITMDEKFRSK